MRDIYLTLDADHNGSYEQSLPTGLSDVSFLGGDPPLNWATGGIPAALELTAAGDELTLGFNRPVLEAADDLGFGFHLAHPATERVRLAELIGEPAPGGLSALTARALLVRRSANGDADADGQPDSADPSPSTPAGAKTAPQRALLRALTFYFRTGTSAEGRNLQVQHGPATPCRALYLEPAAGVPAVQFSSAPDTYGIWLDTPLRREAYQLMLAGAPSRNRIRLGLALGADFRLPPDSASATKACASVEIYSGGCQSSVVLLTELHGELYPIGLPGT
jgi:hypothetical protein